MEEIEFSSWPRREHYTFFGGVSNPFYMVTFRQDITAVYEYVKAHGLSFYYAMTWLVTSAVNRVDAFHYMTDGNSIYRMELRAPSFTDLAPGEELFRIITMPPESMSLGIADFCLEAARRSAAQKSFIIPETESEELLYISCLPWMDITAVTNERDLDRPESRYSAIPSITWGRYTEENGRKILGISIEVNHRFIDGLHLGLFVQSLTDEIDSLLQLP